MSWMIEFIGFVCANKKLGAGKLDNCVAFDWLTV